MITSLTPSSSGIPYCISRITEVKEWQEKMTYICRDLQEQMKYVQIYKYKLRLRRVRVGRRQPPSPLRRFACRQERIGALTFTGRSGNRGCQVWNGVIVASVSHLHVCAGRIHGGERNRLRQDVVADGGRRLHCDIGLRSTRCYR